MYRKLALCIGNDNYEYSCLNKLQCAVNDSNAIAEKLRKMGFEVIEFSNLNREHIHLVVDDFEERLAKEFDGEGFIEVLLLGDVFKDDIDIFLL